MKTAASTAHVASATCGECQRGCTRPSAGGSALARPGRKRDARRAGEPGRRGAAGRQAHDDGERHDDPPDVRRVRSGADRLHDALNGAELLRRHERQDRAGHEQIRGNRDRAGDEDRRREIARRIANLVAHRRGELDADHRVAHHREAGRHVPADAGVAPARATRRRSPTRPPRPRAPARCSRTPPARRRSESTCRPPARGCSRPQSSASQPTATPSTNELLVDERRRPGLAAGEREDAGHVDEQHRHVEEVVGPVAPAREKAVRVAECLARPQIDAAFARIPASQCQHRDRLGNEERPEREQPQRERRPAEDRDRRDVVDVDDRRRCSTARGPTARASAASGCDGHRSETVRAHRRSWSHRSNTTRPATSVMSTLSAGSISGEMASGFCGEHREIGPLAGFDAAAVPFVAGRDRAAHGVGVQRFRGGDRLGRRDQMTRRCPAV